MSVVDSLTQTKTSLASFHEQKYEASVFFQRIKKLQANLNLCVNHFHVNSGLFRAKSPKTLKSKQWHKQTKHFRILPFSFLRYDP